MYNGAMFFMGLKIAEFGKYSMWIPSSIKWGTVCPLIPKKYYTKCMIVGLIHDL